MSYLTEELVRQGHDVTLFASGDSLTTARLVPCSPKALRLDPSCIDQVAHQFVMLDNVVEHVTQNAFDVVHFHIDYFHFPISRAYHIPHLTTLHGRLDLPDLQPLYNRYPEMPVVSISNAQRKPLRMANWIGNVYHGLPADALTAGQGAGKYLAFIGRVCPEKRVDRAIEIAIRTGLPLKIAAKIDRVDRDYYESKIKPLLQQPGIEFVGEIREDQKSEFLGNASALLFPIDWPEPFGLAVIEAMACGTPTLAFRCGSVPEIVMPGLSGQIVDTVDEAVATMENLLTMDRAGGRRAFEDRFAASRMARDYVSLYESIVANHETSALESAAALSLPQPPMEEHLIL